MPWQSPCALSWERVRLGASRQRWCVTLLVMSFLDDYAQLCNIPVAGRRQPYGRDALVDFSEQYAPQPDPYFIQDRKQNFSVTVKLNCGERFVSGSQNVVPGN